MLSLRSITKIYKAKSGDVAALKGITLDFRDHEFVAILGPSGCGKTTMLNIVGGLDRYTSGDLLVDNLSTSKFSDADWDSYRNHSVGFVFQNYNLIPHQTVLANVEMALVLSGASKKERTQKAKAALERVGLASQIHKKPLMLSGGQMQRVAIARALVNNPTIVLADEPTGALDSKTSVDVMDLLEEISKDHLVVMVTHNPELAQKYATRIVTLKDGEVTSDSNPPSQSEVADEVEPPRFTHTHLGFFSALSLSFNNLLTKVGRTFLTAFAGAIGIIGIALILSLSNGMNAYIDNVEADTMGSYPITINKQSVDMDSMMEDHEEVISDMKQDVDTKASDAETPTDITSRNRVKKNVQMSENMIHDNDLGAFKTYLQEHKDQIEPYVNSIEYQYNVNPQVYSYAQQEDSTLVSPTQLFGETQSMMLASDTSYFSSMSSQWKQIPESSELRDGRYKLIEGSWPEAANEAALVLDANGCVSDYILYKLGLLDPAKLDELVQAGSDNADVDDPIQHISFADALAKSYVVFSPSELYQKEGNLWINKANDPAFMKGMKDKGQPVQITAILQAKDNTTVSDGVLYTQALTNKLMEIAQNEDIVKDQLADTKTNVLTGKPFLNDAATSASNTYRAFQNSMSFSDYEGGAHMFFAGQTVPIELPDGMTQEEAQALVNLVAHGVPAEKLSAFIEIVSSGTCTLEQLKTLGVDTDALMQEVLSGITPEQFLAMLSDEQKQEVAKELIAHVEPSELVALLDQNELNALVASYVSTVSPDALLAALTPEQLAAIQAELMKNIDMSALVEQYTKGQDTEALVQDYFKNLTPDQMQDLAKDMDLSSLDENALLAQMSTAAPASYDGVMAALGYATPEQPTEIMLYPKDFDAKDPIDAFITSYNDQTAKDSEKIAYTDLVGIMTKSVRNVVNMITLALLAFVAISLVVSSIMIAIITYISVLERTKEIGILRSLGASKGGVSRIFTAETFIEGLLSGILGVVLAGLLTIPISAFVESTQHVSGIAQLTVLNALVLIGISVGLTLLAGFVPSLMAAKKDPVVALRSE